MPEQSQRRALIFGAELLAASNAAPAKIAVADTRQRCLNEALAQQVGMQRKDGLDPSKRGGRRRFQSGVLDKARSAPPRQLRGSAIAA